mmetsp:Transcript_100217/g.157955  ORF Transcript_100217/g.157955 Transcript_100217/m.157955 type:complete len:153 (-) Transcript_100217:99-557(-)
MAQIDSLALPFTICYAIAVIAGGAYGYISKGSKASIIASTICAIIPVILAATNIWIGCGIFACLMVFFFGKKTKSSVANPNQGGCVVMNSSEAVPEKPNDPMNKYIRPKEEPLLGEDLEREKKIAANSKVIFITLTVLSIVEAVVSFWRQFG